MRYICRTGCQWRSLPTCFPPWSAVYYYFRRWQLTGLWQTLNEAVNQADQLAAGRPATPSLSCLDSQRVRLAPRSYEHRGLDGGKRVNGRKRQIVTAVQGRSLACRVHAANGHDGVEALALLPAQPRWGQRLVTVVTDKGYQGRFARHVAKLGLTHQVAVGHPVAAASYQWPNAGWWSAPLLGSPAFGGWPSLTNLPHAPTKPGCYSPT